MVVAAEAGLPVEEYGPNEVKSAVTGMGNADKPQVQSALVRRPRPPRACRRSPTPPTPSPSRSPTSAGGPHCARAVAQCGVAMISFLEGEVVEKGADRVVLAVGGVGYERAGADLGAWRRSRRPGEPARVHTRMVVRDDAMTLYGFATTDERELFDLLTGVTGVGPKVALSLPVGPDARRAPPRGGRRGDAAALTVVPGVGKKVAQRVVLDLRDRAGRRGRSSRSRGRWPTCARPWWRSG